MRLQIGHGVDAIALDSATGYSFASSGGGTVTVAKVNGSGKITTVQKVQTVRGARTIAIDLKTHKICLATASFETPIDPMQTKVENTGNTAFIALNLSIILFMRSIALATDTTSPTALPRVSRSYFAPFLTASGLLSDSAPRGTTQIIAKASPKGVNHWCSSFPGIKIASPGRSSVR